MDFVTGVTGFIGRVLAMRLIAQGGKVRSVVRDPSKARALQEAGLEVITGDLRNPRILPRALEGVERVYHLAGVTRALDGRDYWEGNVQVTLLLARTFSQFSAARFIHVSSLTACGPSLPGEPRTEEIAPAPVSLFGRSKLSAELAVTDLPEPISWVVVRPPIVYGPGDHDILLLLRAARRGLVPMVNPEQVCSLIYVHDLVTALILCGSAPEAHRQTYHLTCRPDLTCAEMADAAGVALGRKVKCLKIPAWGFHLACQGAHIWSMLRGRPGVLSPDKAIEMVQPAWHCSAERIEKDLNWKAETAHAEGLAHTALWYQEKGLL